VWSVLGPLVWSISSQGLWSLPMLVCSLLEQVPAKWTRFAERTCGKIRSYSAFRIIVDHELIHYEQDACRAVRDGFRGVIGQASDFATLPILQNRFHAIDRLAPGAHGRRRRRCGNPDVVGD
jgi:hypothetical protein